LAGTSTGQERVFFCFRPGKYVCKGGLRLHPGLIQKARRLGRCAAVTATLSRGDKPGARAVPCESSDNPFIRPYGKPLVAAHRAGAGIVPENTLMAFENCLGDAGFDIDLFELDVHLTRDGELVVLHNNTYDATSNAVEAFGKKNVYPADYTIEQLQVLNLGEHFCLNGRYPYRGLRGSAIPSNLRVHTLGDILDLVLSSGKKRYYFSIDVKNRGETGAKAAAKLYEIVGERNLFGEVIAASFNPSVTRFYDEHCPLMRRSANPPEVLKFYYASRLNEDLSSRNLRFSLLQIPYGVYRKPWGTEIIHLGTKAFINYAHRHNIAVQYWTVNTADKMLYLRDNGCDAVMTDYPDLAYRTLSQPQ